MSSARGLANHSLYMAKLLLEAWSDAEAAAPTRQQALNAAFAPALRNHLLDAYGWFLLALMRQTKLPGAPPHCTAQLPQRGPGIAEPGEIDEYRQAEQQGWLAGLQKPLPKGLPPARRNNMLAVTGTYPGYNDYREYCSTLDALFQRMADSVDEH